MSLEQTIKTRAEELLIHLQVGFDKVEVEFLPEKEIYRINITTEEPSLLIGHHGETIGAFQHILKVVIWKEDEGAKSNILVDVDNYRQRQEASVLKMVSRKIDLVRESNKEQKLPPMSPYFRRLVHMQILEHDDLTTRSQGDGDHRYVIISLK